jgi:hypothetical protein
MKAAWMVEVIEVAENAWMSSAPSSVLRNATHILKGFDE